MTSKVVRVPRMDPTRADFSRCGTAQASAFFGRCESEIARGVFFRGAALVVLVKHARTRVTEDDRGPGGVLVCGDVIRAKRVPQNVAGVGDAR